MRWCASKSPKIYGFGFIVPETYSEEPVEQIMQSELILSGTKLVHRFPEAIWRDRIGQA